VGQDGASGLLGIELVGLAIRPSSRPIRAVDLEDPNASCCEVLRQGRAVEAGSLDSDGGDIAM